MPKKNFETASGNKTNTLKKILLKRKKELKKSILEDDIAEDNDFAQEDEKMQLIMSQEKPRNISADTTTQLLTEWDEPYATTESEDTQKLFKKEFTKSTQQEQKSTTHILKTKISSMQSKFRLLQKKRSQLNKIIGDCIIHSGDKTLSSDIIENSIDNFSKIYNEANENLEKEFSPENLGKYDFNEFRQLHTCNIALKETQKKFKSLAYILQSFGIDKKHQLLTHDISIRILEAIEELYHIDFWDFNENQDMLNNLENPSTFPNDTCVKFIESLKKQRQEDIPALQSIFNLLTQAVSKESEMLSKIKENDESNKTNNNNLIQKIISEKKEILDKCDNIKAIYTKIEEQSKEAISRIQKNGKRDKTRISERQFLDISIAAIARIEAINAKLAAYSKPVDELQYLKNTLENVIKECSNQLNISITDFPQTHEEYLMQKQKIISAIKKMNDKSSAKKHNIKLDIPNESEEFSVNKGNELLKKYEIAYENYTNPDILKSALEMRSEIFEPSHKKNNSNNQDMNLPESYVIPVEELVDLSTPEESQSDEKNQAQKIFQEQYQNKEKDPFIVKDLLFDNITKIKSDGEDVKKSI